MMKVHYMFERNQASKLPPNTAINSRSFPANDPSSKDESHEKYIGGKPVLDDPDDILAGLDAELLAKPLRIAFGKGAKDMNFLTQNLTVRKLIEDKFSDFERGKKDGTCLLSGDCEGGQRIANNMRVNYIVMIDIDTGQSVDAIADKIEAAGLFAVIYTTHSHLKPQSDFAEDRFVRWAMKRDLDVYEDGLDLVPVAKDFMRTETKIDETICQSVTKAYFDFGVGGTKLFVDHAPMPRVRALFVLDKPFSFHPQQKVRQAEWKERVYGFATKLGLQLDRSGVDPSRLMYLPRFGDDGVAAWQLEEEGLEADESGNFAYARRGGDCDRSGWSETVHSEPDDNDTRERSDAYVQGAELGSGNGGVAVRRIHQIIYIKGRALTLDDMPRIAKDGKVDDAFTEAAEELGAVVGERRKYATKGLAKFMATVAKDFHPTLFFEYHQVASRKVDGIKYTYMCPGDENHGDAGNPDDKGFYCVDAEHNENGFSMHCSHDSCKTMYNNDRALFLDKACQNFGIEHAKELLQFCPGHEYDNLEDEIAEEIAAEEGGFDTLLDALDKNSPPAFVSRVLKTLAKKGLTALEEDRHLSTIAKKSGATKRIVNATFNEFKREEEASALSDVTGNMVFETPPHMEIPSDPATANTIYSTWDFREQVRIVLGRFVAMNDKDPTMFARSEGGYVRLTWRGDKARLDEIYKVNQWMVEVSERMNFVKMTPDDATHVKPFDNVMAYFDGSNKLKLPEIERIVNVPVFGADGSLRTDKGYDWATKTYLNPSGEFLPVPDVVTQEDVDEALYWLHEPLRDIPFSDVFDGTECAPILLDDELDGDGYPALNVLRGQSSRANYFAMLLQPFARNLIDGECPQYHVDKPKAGTGASLLISMRHEVAAGGKLASISLNGKSEDEINKLVTALLREGSDCLPFDNLDVAIKSPSLAELATSGLWRGRILGVSRTVDMVFNGTLIFAGNNTPFDSQMLRRNVPIRIDANTPNPAEDRQTFKYPELKRWVQAHRQQLVWSCHVLVKQWIQAGCPKSTTARLASFEVWAGVMGGILETAGVAGFLANRDAYTTASVDDETNTGQALLQAVWADLKTAPFAAKDIIDLCWTENGNVGVRQTAEMGYDGLNQGVAVKRLAGFLKQARGNVFKLGDGSTVKLIIVRECNPVKFALVPSVLH